MKYTKMINERKEYFMEYEEHQKITLTIEEQLETYTRCRNATERHKCLWHAWNHNKRWLIQLLEWVMPSFPTYSKHDVSHAETVIHNIEMLMGENVIKNLSASDCFLILHVIYIHDIGMCITSEYRKELMDRPEFINFLRECRSDPILREYADILLLECEELRESLTGSKNDCLEKTPEQEKTRTLQMKLKVYYAVMYLVAEYRRYNHGQESQKILLGWIADNSQLGAGFSTSGIPSRFFYTIGTCASVHTSYDFNDIMSLPKQDGGYAHDYMHPRFAAVLLQLGDALDLDNDRFHPLMESFNYNIPAASKLHIGKHKAIRRLRISPSRITIHANCEFPEELRLVQREYEGIKDILKNATFNWSAICPEDLDMVLPELEQLFLMLNGEAISADLVKTGFRIQQPKAFNLLQGSNIYRNEKFVFLREVFQNAVDATKLEYWKDWKGSRWRKNGEKNCEQFLDSHAYPIEVEFHLAIKGEYDRKYRILDTEDDYKCYVGKRRKDDSKEEIENPEFGVVVKVTDYGTGITKKDILEIANVGSKYIPSASIYADMPEWLKPTAEFGLGLQSIFLVTDYFKAHTHARNGECYEIEFNGTGEKGDGSINVVPVSSSDQAYGTCFEIFVSSEHKEWEQVENLVNTDPFNPNIQDAGIQLERSRALIVQMVLYLDEIVKEKLFPVKIEVFDYDSKDSIFSIVEKNSIKNLYVELIVNGQSYPISEENKKEEVTWTYKDSKRDDNKIKTIDNCKYLFDFSNGCLKIANSDNSFYACFSSERLIKLRKHHHNSELQQKYMQTQIYYKGVYVTEYTMDEDLNMLEYIDIKGSLEREYLAMNRAEFTEAGEIYIRENLYPQILDYILKAIDDYASSDECKNLKGYLKEENKEEIGFEQENDDDRTLRKYLFFIGIVAFTHSRTRNTYLVHMEDTEQTERNKQWDEMLKLLSKYVKEQVSKNRFIKEHWSHSTFYQMNIYEIKEASKNSPETIERFRAENLADIFITDRKYAIISIRKETQGSWNEILVKLNNDSQKDIKSEIMSLKIQSDLEKKVKLVEKIEERLQSIATLVHNIEDSLSWASQENYVKEHQILVWMLENIPSLAIYTNTDNTLRINILDYEHTDSVYMNKNLRLAIYQRIIDTCKKDPRKQRFSTVASTAFCQLGLEKGCPGVYFLKRGKFGKVGRRKIILPLTGQTLCILQDWLEHCFPSRVFNLYERIYECCRLLVIYSNNREQE